MLFAAGHGIKDRDGKFFLAGRETDPKTLEMTAMNWDEIAELLNDLPARVIVFLDACHAGAAGEDTVTATNDGAVTSLLRNKNSVTVISASKGRQASQERAAIGGGVFSVSLAQLISDPKADANGNHVLELSEVYGALKSRVVRTTSGAQTPWVARNQMVGEIPLF